MGIFGKLDKSNVPSNPFYVPEGEYNGVVNKVGIKDLNKGPRFVITYKITDDGPYKGKPVSDFFTVFPDLTDEDFEQLDDEEKAEVEAALAALRKRLVSLGVDWEEDVDEDFDGQQLVKTEVQMGITNWGDDNKGTNVAWAKIITT